MGRINCQIIHDVSGKLFDTVTVKHAVAWGAVEYAAVWGAVKHAEVWGAVEQAAVWWAIKHADVCGASDPHRFYFGLNR